MKAYPIGSGETREYESPRLLDGGGASPQGIVFLVLAIVAANFFIVANASVAVNGIVAANVSGGANINIAYNVNMAYNYF